MAKVPFFVLKTQVPVDVGRRCYIAMTKPFGYPLDIITFGDQQACRCVTQIVIPDMGQTICFENLPDIRRHWIGSMACLVFGGLLFKDLREPNNGRLNREGVVLKIDRAPFQTYRFTSAQTVDYRERDDVFNDSPLDGSKQCFGLFLGIETANILFFGSVTRSAGLYGMMFFFTASCKAPQITIW